MEEDIKKLLEENLKLSRETHTMMKKMQRYAVMRTFFSFIYLLLIIGPIIIAFIYLPPLIKPYISQYQELLDSFSAVQKNIPNGNSIPLQIPSSDPANTQSGLLNMLKNLGINGENK